MGVSLLNLSPGHFENAQKKIFPSFNEYRVSDICIVGRQAMHVVSHNFSNRAEIPLGLNEKETNRIP